MTSSYGDQLFLNELREFIAPYPDFPKPGIIFQDLMPVFSNGALFQRLVKFLAYRIRDKYPDVQYIVGIESRGFILGAAIAHKLGKGFVPVRKQGKLPGKCRKHSYTLEYGSDTLEVQETEMKSGVTVVLVDDLLATGGTMTAACTLLRECQVEILECIVVIELEELKAAERIRRSFQLFSMLKL